MSRTRRVKARFDIKRSNPPYQSGDSDAWVKVKVTGWAEANRTRFKRS